MMKAYIEIAKICVSLEPDIFCDNDGEAMEANEMTKGGPWIMLVMKQRIR
jgi:hypothetical protein